MSEGKTEFRNTGLDTGEGTERGSYLMVDKTYADLLEDLEEQDFKHVTLPLKQNILRFYSKATPPKTQDEERLKKWQEVQENLAKLKKINPSP